MCGLAGIVNLSGAEQTPAELERLRSMSKTIAHRGPDGEDYWADGPVAFAFRRLSVIDVAGGRQPFVSEDGEVVAMVNGTIYNYVDLQRRLARGHEFRTASDCEVAIHLYEDHGAGFAGLMHGQFALALYDRRRRRVYLIRDRLGIKPLFYARAGQRVLFASEIKALLRHPDCPRRLDWEGLLEDPTVFGALPTDPEPTSGFLGIHHLAPGAILEIDLASGRIAERDYWTLPQPGVAVSEGDAADHADAYADLLFDVVGEYLIGESKIGVALSGGVDSALLGTIAAAKTEGVETFSVFSESTIANGDALGAFQLARHVGAAHSQVSVPEALTPEHWRQLLWLCESPLCGPEQLYKNEIFRFARESVPGLKVMLSGQGADEFTGGFTTVLAPGPEPAWPQFLRVVDELTVGVERMRRSSVALWDSHLGAPIVRRLDPAPEGKPIDSYDRFVKAKRRDLVMHNLWQEDRLASGSSIEARAPYLDHRLIEIALAIPTEFHERLLWDKQLIRLAAERVLPPEFARRPKVPFFVGPKLDAAYRPMLELMSADDYGLLEDSLGSGEAADFVDWRVAAAALEAMKHDFVPARVDLIMRLFNMGLLEKMAAEQVDSSSESPRSRAFRVDDWGGAEAEALADRLKGVPRLRDEAVFAVDETVMVLRADRNGNGSAGNYLAVGGRLEFEIDDPDWLAVLQRLDGTTAIGPICDEVGVRLENVWEDIAIAVDHGVLGEVDAPRDRTVSTDRRSGPPATCKTKQARR